MAEITQAKPEQPVQVKSEHRQAPTQYKEDVMMQEASAEESKNNSAPPKESENEQMKSVEEEWRQLKIQNHVLNTENRSINVDATLKF